MRLYTYRLRFSRFHCLNEYKLLRFSFSYYQLSRTYSMTETETIGKVNLSKLGKQYCPCQNNLPEPEWQAEPLQRVRSRMHYEIQHDSSNSSSNRRQGFQLESSTGPSIPTTEKGTEITFDNFPDANLVCPVCEDTFIVVCDIRQEEASECPICNGEGWLELHDVAREKCANCDGTGQKNTS
jgi:hypothetical protein